MPTTSFRRFASRFSFEDPIKIIQDLLGQIDVIDKPAYKRITLIGHSLSGPASASSTFGVRGNADALSSLVFATRARGHGRKRSDRLILMAGMNRGWSISSHMGFKLALLMRIGVFVGAVLSIFRGRPPLIFTIRRGSTFITQLRIQWLSIAPQKREADWRGRRGERRCRGRSRRSNSSARSTISSRRKIISTWPPAGFIYLDVPRSGHDNVIDLDDAEAGPGRREVFIKALTEDPATLKAESLKPADHQIRPIGRSRTSSS